MFEKMSVSTWMIVIGVLMMVIGGTVAGVASAVKEGGITLGVGAALTFLGIISAGCLMIMKR